jgi:hypothetical protein
MSYDILASYIGNVDPSHQQRKKSYEKKKKNIVYMDRFVFSFLDIILNFIFFRQLLQ